MRVIKMQKSASRFLRNVNPITVGIALALSFGQATAAEEIQFNTDVLDIKDRSHIDLAQFSRAGYVMPGEYTLSLLINKSTLSEREVLFLTPENDPKGSEACLTPEIVREMGLKEAVEKDLKWWHDGQCLDISSLPGMSVQGDLSRNALVIGIPQAFLEYTAENWDPPARWDDGIPGVLFDYNLTGQNVRQKEMDSNISSLTGSGVAGINLGAWRLRADWQSLYNNSTTQNNNANKRVEWSRYYLYRALPSLRAKMTLGENYLGSGMFDSFRFIGGSLVSDDNMLPPNLRGYAPEVVGVAKTNAKVTVSQQGRVLYETTVAAGPFRIQDLNNAVSGKLDVSIQEQDGSVSNFQVETSTIPYLTRPGSVRYKVFAGKPADYNHHTDGPTFASGEFSWGIDNGWSLFGGALTAGDYNSAALGIGRDLLALGAISADVTQSHAVLPEEGTKSGGSYRLSYSKRFEETDSRVTFAGYRFSERSFMNMSQYLNARYYRQNGANLAGGKELYTITFNQQFRTLDLSAYLSYNHQTYWDRPANDTYSLSLAHYFDFMGLKKLSVNATAYRNKYNNVYNDGAYLGISIPWGSTGSIRYDAQVSKGSSSHSVGYSDNVDEQLSYSLSTGITNTGEKSGAAYATYRGDKNETTMTVSQQDSGYTALGMTLKGGVTATTNGAALHRVGVSGGTRMLVDTSDVGGVPVRGGGSVTHSNMFGKAVVTDVNSYYRTNVTVDLNKLDDDVEAMTSVVEGTLTEGAIGYRKFGMIAGRKAMAIIKLANGTTPPFGASVKNKNAVQTGIVNGDGQVWLSGIVVGEKMSVTWDGKVQCQISLPQTLPENIDEDMLLLPCEVE